MAKWRAKSQIGSLILDHQKSGIALISLRSGGVLDTIENILTRAITLLQTSSRLEVFKRSYGPPKLRESQFRKFWDSNLRVLGQNDICMLAPWPSINNTIRGKVVAFPKSRPCWVLWVRVCLWFIYAPKVLQLCTNQLIVWFVQVRVNNWLVCHSS
jgi:hypothetical protein